MYLSFENLTFWRLEAGLDVPCRDPLSGVRGSESWKLDWCVACRDPLSAMRDPKAERWELGAGSWKLEAGSWKLGAES